MHGLSFKGMELETNLETLLPCRALPICNEKLSKKERHMSSRETLTQSPSIACTLCPDHTKLRGSCAFLSKDFFFVIMFMLGRGGVVHTCARGVRDWERMLNPPRAGITGSCEPPSLSADPNLSPLQNSHVL